MVCGDIGVPIRCKDKHIATLFLGQFFYTEEIPDKDFFNKQAERFGYDKNDYFSALHDVPRFEKKRVDEILKYNIALAAFLSNLATKNMEKQFEIEQRKNAENELRNLRNYLANIIDSMPSTLIGVDPEGIITQWNKRAEDLTGLTAKQAIGTPLVQAMPGLNTEIEHIKQAISSCKKQTYGTVSNIDESTQKI